jgi:ankyrin repeat protein
MHDEARELLLAVHCKTSKSRKCGYTAWVCNSGHVGCAWVSLCESRGRAGCYRAAQCIAISGVVQLLEYAADNGVSWKFPGVMATAAKHGRGACLAWLHVNGCPRNTTTMACAASSGHVKCLKWLHANGFRFSRSATTAAARGGQVHCLQWLIAHGCETTWRAALAAARYGHLDSLQLLHASGCPWLPVE